ncbi:conserved hypothetical protein [Hyphomicrobium sp. GJ21]|nr:conserved hypothetical protein [Hyphomicrobium sp. GJ21]
MGERGKLTINLLQSSKMAEAHSAPRCSAKSRRTGKPCQAPAVKGWRVCRLHGAKGGAPSGEANGRYRTGLHTKTAIETRRAVRKLIREALGALKTLS